MNSNLWKGLVASLALSGLPAVLSAAPMLYGADYGGPAPLYDIDTATGTATSVGGAPLVNVGDLTSNLVDNIWGVTISGTNQLVSISPLTGNITNTVAITGTSANNGGGEITSLAYNPLTGVLYGNTTPGFGDTVGGDDLYTIDPLTGVATLVGRIGFENVFALAFDNLGTLYGISETSTALISLDLLTGNGSLIAGGLEAGLFDMAANPDDNTMYVSRAFADGLGTIDTATGVITPVGPYVDAGADNIAGLAFIGTPVPEPTSLALVGLGIVALGARVRSRS